MFSVKSFSGFFPETRVKSVAEANDKARAESIAYPGDVVYIRVETGGRWQETGYWHDGDYCSIVRPNHGPHSMDAEPCPIPAFS